MAGTVQGDKWVLYYWPGFKGRAEFVRLVFEEAGIPYLESNQGVADSIIKGEIGGYPVMMPPVVAKGDFRLGQTQMICQYLAGKYGLAPKGEEDKIHAEQVCASMYDYLTEGYGAFHGAKPGVKYADQKEEAQRYIDRVVQQRLPRYLKHFETVLAANTAGTGFLFGDSISHADLALFHIMNATEFQFPEVYKSADYIPLLKAHRDRIASRPNIVAYTQSERCKPFSGDSFM
uniref:Sigma-class glutathione S-transferase n=1 Tax=Laternula elliptica TaxID=228457 RepID=B9VX80_LATEL|nr:sigma-class glutathione S-transferase [Laternula elliptica]